MLTQFTVGRVPVIATVEQLKEADLIRIMTEPKNSVVKQFQQLFAQWNVNLQFSPDSIKAMARQAIEKNTGARGLKASMVNYGIYL